MLPFALPFARPTLLCLLALLPLLGLLALIATRKRRSALAKFGRPETVTGLSTLRPGSRRRSRLLLFAGLAFLILAVAGPRWGKGGESGVVVGRDMVIVLDLSRSMTAADMADSTNQQRWQAAQAGVHQLLSEVRQHGGHRLGLVVFAAKPWIVCPLTSDYDHFRADWMNSVRRPRLRKFDPSPMSQSRLGRRSAPPSAWRWPPTIRAFLATRTSC